MNIFSVNNLFLNRQLDNKNRAVTTTNSLKLNSLKADVVSFSGTTEVAKTAVKAAINLSRKTINDLPKDLSGQRVLLRVDHNVTFNKADGSIADDTRIQRTLDTIIDLINRKAKVIIATHVGDPQKVKDGKAGKTISTKIIAERLQKLLNERKGFENINVIHTSGITGDEVIEQTHNLKPGQILYLENVRTNPAEHGKKAVLKEGSELYESVKIPKTEMEEHAREFAKLGDIYVNDAFGAAHRDHVSTSKVAKYIQGPKVAGLLMDKEIKELSRVLQNPERPFVAVIGGSKVSTKIGVLDKLLEKVNTLIVGGGMSNTFEAARGGKIGNSLYEADQMDIAKQVMIKTKEKGVDLLLPKDVVAADKFSNDATTKVVSANQIPDGWQGLDIGPNSIDDIKHALKDAKTILWNGPVGVFEMPRFANGSNEVANAIAETTKKNKATSILGGGDTINAVKNSGIQEEEFTHISTGGGASLEMIEKNGNLPGIACLDEK